MANFETLQIKRGTTAEWASANPILASGELGVDLTTFSLKSGNGTAPWSVLPAIGDQHLIGVASGNRPLTPTSGLMILDTTLNHPIFFDGTDWKDFSGSIT